MCLPLVVSWLRFVPDWRNSSRSRGLSTLNSVFCLRHLLHLNHNIEELSLFLTSSLERTCSVNHFLLQSSMRHQELLSSLFSPLGKKLIVFSKISESGKRLYTWIIYHLMIIQTLNLFVYVYFKNLSERLHSSHVSMYPFHSLLYSPEPNWTRLISIVIIRQIWWGGGGWPSVMDIKCDHDSPTQGHRVTREARWIMLIYSDLTLFTPCPRPPGLRWGSIAVARVCTQRHGDIIAQYSMWTQK